MPRTCTICSHGEKEAIDQALVSGEPYRHIARRTGTSTAALQRHKSDHIPLTLAKATEAHEVAHADDLLGRVRWLCGRAEAFLREAEGIQREARADGDKRLAVLAVHAGLKALRELRESVRLLGQLTNQLEPQPRVLVISLEQQELVAQTAEEMDRDIARETIDVEPEPLSALSAPSERPV